MLCHNLPALRTRSIYTMLKVEHPSQLPSSLAPTPLDAVSSAAPQEDAASARTDVTCTDKVILRRLHVTLDARCIALVLSDEASARTRLLNSFTRSLPAAEYRVLWVSVPPCATRASLTRLVAGAATLPGERSSVSAGSSLPAYNLLRRFEADAVRSHMEGQRTLVVIDDAQLLSADGMHFVHTLSNITAENDLAVALVLAAAPSFARRLRRPTWSALASRTGAVIRLSHE